MQKDSFLPQQQPGLFREGGAGSFLGGGPDELAASLPAFAPPPSSYPSIIEIPIRETMGPQVGAGPRSSRLDVGENYLAAYL